MTAPSDNDIDVWGEEEILNNNFNTDDDMIHLSDLNREWKRRHGQFHTMGYMEGITSGKEASAQEGFNVGFEQSVYSGYKWGLVRGTSCAYANLPDNLKEKLAGKPETRDRLQKLCASSRMISTTDALGNFHKSIQNTETRPEQSECNSPLVITDGETSNCNQLDSLFKELVSLLHDSPEIRVKVEPVRHSLSDM